ncbi:MAG TPA: S9 family peptidase [Chloroflexota bacterium]|nr:S9 family peptidase [Chloroflexota bacterium]HUM68854.1 S9 family peptidase [Chloroflexota bacterium]
MTHPTPPQAAIHPHELTLHGRTRTDNYFWLRERENPDVLAYLAAENAYMQAMMAHTEPLQDKLYQEMVGRIQETDSTVPVRLGDNYYYTRTEAGLQYEIHCRKVGSLDAPEEILIDENALAEGQPYFKMGIFKPSPDQKILAYSTDTSGGERYTMHFKNLDTGELLPDQVPNTSYTAEWGNDNQTIFYTVQNEEWRNYQLRRHTLGTDTAHDPVLHQEDDALFNVMVSKTKDKAYLLLIIFSLESSEEHFLDANQPLGTFQRFHPRQERVQYFLFHRQGTFYIHTNEQAPNFKVMTTPAGQPEKSNWQTFIPHNPERFIETLDLFDGHLAVYGRANGLRTLQIHTFADGLTRDVPFPEPVYSYTRADNPESNTNKLRFVYQSLTTADTTYDLNMDDLAREFKKQLPVLGGYEASDYVTERIWATAVDGTKIPISLVYRQGVPRNSQTPCLLYAYGSYGANMEPRFDQKRLCLIDRGFIYAIAHIRGGQEMGRHWYDQGKWLHKKNTFTDFIACAEHLIAQNYTSADRLAIMGRSAGGLLMGAVTVMRPDLFKVVVAGVPFVDVVTTMLDESIPLTTGEFEEWGNPKIKEYFDYMLSYSPYDNTTAQAYPHLLITCGLNDPRVQYWEPAKWAAKLRTVKTDNNHLLLKTFMGAGHFSSSGRYDYLKDTAFEYAFILDIFEIGD